MTLIEKAKKKSSRPQMTNLSAEILWKAKQKICTSSRDLFSTEIMLLMLVLVVDYQKKKRGLRC